MRSRITFKCSTAYRDRGYNFVDFASYEDSVEVDGNLDDEQAKDFLAAHLGADEDTGAEPPSRNGKYFRFIRVESVEDAEERKRAERAAIDQHFEEALNTSFDDSGIRDFFRNNKNRNAFYENLTKRLETGWALTDNQVACVKADYEQ